MAKNQVECNTIASDYVNARNTISREPVEEYTIYNCMLRSLSDDYGSFTENVFSI